MTQTPSPTEVICKNVRNMRRQRGWSARELAERCRSAGLTKWNREIVANIENGRRSSISIEELFVLAVVFGVAPIALAVPLREAEYAVTPQVTVHPWRAAQWISGTAERPIGTNDADPTQLERWAGATIPIHVYQKLDSAINQLLEAERDYELAEEAFHERAAGVAPEVAAAARIRDSFPAQLAHLSSEGREQRSRLMYYGQRAEHMRLQLEIHRRNAADAIKYLVLSGLPAPDDLVSIADRLPNGDLIRASRTTKEESSEGGERADSQDS